MPENRLPRSDWMALVLGLVERLIPFVAIVFTFLSYRISNHALETSQQNLRVGQRAYLTVTRTTIKPQRPITAETPSSLIIVSADVKNTGNTPAEITLFRMRPLELYSQWSFSGAFNSLLTAGPPNSQVSENNSHIVIAPSEVATVQIAGVFRKRQQVLAPDMYSRIAWANLRMSIDYDDVFKERHSLNWCWGVKTDAAILTACADELLMPVQMSTVRDKGRPK